MLKLLTREELIGQQHGRWTILDTEPAPRVKQVVRCQCECGNEAMVILKNILYHNSTQCKECAHKGLQVIKLGERYGKWTVLKGVRVNKKWRYECVCDCGGISSVESGDLVRHRVRNGGCRKCAIEAAVKRTKDAFWASVIRGALRRNIQIDMSFDDALLLLEIQENKCALSGLQIKVAESVRDHSNGLTTASLDRINSSLGYTKENVQWVHKDLNKLKLDYTQQAFLEMCAAVTKHKQTIIPVDSKWYLTA